MNARTWDEMLNEAQELHQQYMGIIEYSQGQDRTMTAILGEMESIRQRWQDCETENGALKTLLKSFEEEHSSGKENIDRLQIQLADTRATMAGLAANNEAYEKINKDLRGKLDIISKHVRDGLTTGMVSTITRVCQDYNQNGGGKLNGSTFSVYSEPESLDGIDADLDHNYDRSYTERNYEFGPVSCTPLKRPRSKSQSNVADLEADDEGPIKRSKESPPEIIHKSRHVDFNVASKSGVAKDFHPSTPLVLNESKESSFCRRSVSEPRLGSNPLLRSEFRNMLRKSYVSSGSLNQLALRPHQFAQRSVFRIGELCHECSKYQQSGRIGFGCKAYLCSECGIQVCGECKKEPPLPCVPKATTPRRHARGYLADFTPATSPMIPHLIILCTEELERRGLNEVGLYRVPGKESDVIKLTKDLLWNKVTPDLKQCRDTHVIACCLKKFLNWLKEPVIPRSSWFDFWRASEQGSREESWKALGSAIGGMPKPNRETLAFLMIHLAKVAEKRETNQMSDVNLASVFGPTVVGYSSENSMEHEQAVAEIPRQTQIMMSLFGLPVEFWENHICVESLGAGLLLGVVRAVESRDPTTPVTPEFLPSPMHNSTLLGPLTKGSTMTPPRYKLEAS